MFILFFVFSLLAPIGTNICWMFDFVSFLATLGTNIFVIFDCSYFFGSIEAIYKPY